MCSELITIGRWDVELNVESYRIFKDGEVVFGGEVKKILSKYHSCFDRKFKPYYTIASVCLEDAMVKLNKKRK